MSQQADEGVALIDSSVLSVVDPYWSLVVLVPGVFATLFQIFGSRRTALVFLWIAGAAGFVLGQALADRFFALASVRLGDSHIVESSLAAWVLILVANRVRL